MNFPVICTVVFVAAEVVLENRIVVPTDTNKYIYTYVYIYIYAHTHRIKSL
jgi:hypothetical protein